MKIEIIDNIESLKSYRNRWDEILDENSNNNPFLEQEWIINWWNYFGNEYSLFILMVKNKDSILGFCPLMKIKSFLFTEICFISYKWYSYMDLIVTNESREKIIEFIMNFLMHMKGNFVYNLDGIFESSKNLNIIENCLFENKIQYFTKSIESRYIDINNKSFDNYYKIRSKHHSIKQIRKIKEKTGKLGELTYKKLDYERTNEIFILHEKRWEKKLNGSNFSAGKSKDFFKTLTLNNSDRLEAEIYSLLFNDNLISFVYVIKCKDRFLYYRVAHDDAFGKFSPGRLITYELVKDAFAQQYKLFDFSKGFERYKKEWTDDLIYVNSVIFSNGKFIPSLVLFKAHLKERLRILLKKNSTIVNFKRKKLGKIKYFFSLKHIYHLFHQIKKALYNKNK